jgi:hypothetical protein
VTRLRLGVLFVVLSWLPIAQLVISVSQHNGTLTGEEAAERVRLAIWSAQIVVGLVGVWLAGPPAVEAVRSAGWKRAPANLWRLFRSRDAPRP